MTLPLTHDFKLGQMVLRSATGVSMPERLKVTRAKATRDCPDCRSRIHVGELHGSRPYLHVCLRCVIADPKEARG